MLHVATLEVTAQEEAEEQWTQGQAEGLIAGPLIISMWWSLPEVRAPGVGTEVNFNPSSLCFVATMR